MGVPLHSSPPNDGDVPVIKQLIPTTEKLFSVQPSTGGLQAGQSKNFICQFLPQKVSAHSTTVHVHVLKHVHLILNLQHSLYTCCGYIHVFVVAEIGKGQVCTRAFVITSYVYPILDHHINMNNYF